MNGSELIHLLFRWFHVASAILWVGQLWSLTLVNRWLPGLPTEPALAPLVLRSYNWQRSVSNATWLTGFALLGIVYYGGGALTTVEQSKGLAMGIGLAAFPVGWILYDATWTVLACIPAAAAVLSLTLLTAIGAALSRVMTGRAMFIHLGAILGTIMVVNVQQRVSPIQRRMLGPAGAANPPTERLLETARVRSCTTPASLLPSCSS
jgi:uncharacterized membrane protein